MSNKEQQPLLLEDCDEYYIPSRWEHLQTISKTILHNVNWLSTIAIFVITIALSAMCSEIITDYINQSLTPNAHFSNYDMSREILMDVGNHKLNIDSIDDIEKLENEYSNLNINKKNGAHKKSRSELKIDLEEEDKIIDILKEDVKGEQEIEERLMKKIKILERERLKIVEEQKQHEGNMVWIGIAMSAVICVASAFLFYAITIQRRDSSGENDNVSLQNQGKAIHRSPARASNVTAAN